MNVSNSISRRSSFAVGVALAAGLLLLLILLTLDWPRGEDSTEHPEPALTEAGQPTLGVHTPGDEDLLAGGTDRRAEQAAPNSEAQPPAVEAVSSPVSQGRLVIQAVDASGLPVAGVDLSLWPREAGVGRVLRGLSGPDGRSATFELAAGEWWIRAADSEPTWRVLDAGADLLVPIDVGATHAIRGRVVDHRGRALPGGEVHRLIETGSARRSEVVARADRAGHFELRTREPRLALAGAVPDGPAGEPLEWERRGALAPGEFQPGELELVAPKDALTRSVTVLWPSGEPVSEANLILAVERPLQQIVRTVRTDAHGRWTGQVDMGDACEVFAWAVDRSGASHSARLSMSGAIADPAGTTAAHVLTLDRDPLLALRTVDSNGEALAGAFVEVRTATPGVVHELWTDARGLVELPAGTAFPWRVEAALREHRTARMEIHSLPAGVCELQLESLGHLQLTGWLTTAAGEPAVGFEVSVQLRDDPGAAHGPSRVLADGSFALEGLSPDPVDLWVRELRTGRTVLGPIGAVPGSAPLSLRLPAPRGVERIVGRVIRADGSPAQDVAVSARGFRTSTDAQGRFALDQDPTRPAEHLRLEHAEHGLHWRELQPEARELLDLGEIRLEPVGGLQLVPSNLDVLAGAFFINLSVKDAADIERWQRALSPHSLGEESHWLLPNLPAGSYTVSVATEFGVHARLEVLVEAGRRDSLPIDLAVASDE